MYRNKSNPEQLIRRIVCLAVLIFSANAAAAPADGLVFWNPADRDPGVILTNNNLDVEISIAAVEAVGVRSNRPINPGEGIFYVEMTNLIATGSTYSFGVATASASLQGLGGTGTAALSPFSTSYPAVGMVIDYRGEYPIAHFFADTGSGSVSHLTSQKMRNTHEPVYIYLSAFRNASAVPGQPQHRLTFGTLSPFTYDPVSTIQTAMYQGQLEMEIGWPIDNEHPTISIDSGDQVALAGDNLTYTATATDTESGDLSAQINWFLDGLAVGTGSSVVVSPTVGTHSVRAEVQDAAGLQASATVSADIVVNQGLDHDHDGLKYFEEINLGTNPGSIDTDTDGLIDSDEVAAGTDPLLADSDGDGMTDGYEVENGLNPLVDDAALDFDSDTFSNLAEFQANREAGNVNDYPGHGTVLLNSLDASAGISLQPDSLSFSVLTPTGIEGVRSDIGIAPGSGWHYFEGYRQTGIGNFGFGVATTSASLIAAAGTDSQSVGVSTTGAVSHSGTQVATLVNPSLIDAYGIAVNYTGANPVVHIMVRPTGGDYQVIAPITMTGITSALHIFAYGESQAGVVQQSINAGQDLSSRPFAYSARYLLHRSGEASAETMRAGWGTEYVYQALTSVDNLDDVRLVREPATSPIITLSGDGRQVGYLPGYTDRVVVLANQGMIGEFRYWEARRHIASTLPDGNYQGMGLIGPHAYLDPFCCVSTGPALTGAPPSTYLTTFGAFWRNLIHDGGFDATNDYYGFAVDYRGSRPIVYVIMSGAVVHVMTLDDFITPIHPFMAGHSVGPQLSASANFGATPFQNDARQALINFGVDVTNFVPGWGVYRQNLYLAGGPNAEPTLTIDTSPATGSAGSLVSFTASASDTEDGDLTAQIAWSNDQTSDTATGGSYSFTPPAGGSYRVTALVTDSSGQSYALTATVAVTDDPPIVTAPSDISLNLASGSSVPATNAAIVAFLAGASATDVVDGSLAVSNDAPGTFPVGVTTVTFSATDSASNTASDTATVTVVDTGAPTVTAPSDISLNLASGSSVSAADAAIVTFLAGASAVDDVDGSLAVTNNAPGSFPIGVTTVTFNATDAAGNSASDTATVTVIDTGSPSVTVPSNLSLNLPSGSSIPAADAAIVTFLAGASATDDVDGSLAVTNNAPGAFPVGVTTVTFSATDTAGNTTTNSATVTVVDTGAPTVTPPANLTVNLASGSSVSAADAAIVTFLAAATANDDVDGSLTVTNNAPASFPIGVTTVTFSATDAAGNSATAIATVTVVDTGAPIITVPSNLSLNLPSGSSIPAADAAIVTFLAGASANDDVDGALTVTNNAPGAFPVGVTTVTFSATDTAGNTGTNTATVTVVDTGAPMLTIPANLSLNLPSGSSIPAADAAIVTFLAGASATDDVDGSLAVTNNAPGAFPVGVTTVTFSATDTAGNTTTNSATVTVVDTGAPTVTPPANLTVNLASGSSVSAADAAIVTFLAAATANDDVDGSLTVTNNAPASFPIGVTTVTFSATDAAGNSATAIATVTVVDTGAPIITVPSNLSLNLPSGSSIPATDPSIATFLTGASAIDDVDGPRPVTNNAPGSFPVGVTTVTFSATDTAGNTGTNTATVTVVDTGAPMLTIPANLSLNLPSGSSIPAADAAIVTFLAGASATDDVDGSLAVTNNAPGAFPVGVTTVTFSATDTAGNTTTNSATVTVVDTGAPTVTPPANLTVNLASGSSVSAADAAIVTFLAAATANDDVDGSLTVTNNAPASFPIGVTTVTFSATDAAGNSATAIATVTVVDTGAPIITVPSNLSLNLPSGSSIPATDPSIATFLTGASAIDDVDGPRPVTNNAPGSFPVGVTTVTFSATDTAGNTGSITATVTVVDTGNPTVTPPANLSLNLPSGTTIAATDAAIVTFLASASATDDVDGSLTVTNDAPGSFTIGVTTVTFSAIDATGNAASGTATVTVVDTGAPTVTPPANLSLSLTSGTTVPATDAAIVSFLAAATAMDDVDGTLTVTNNAPTTVFPIGVTVVTFSATDAAGNTGTATAAVSISDAGAPTVTPPADLSVNVASGSSVPATNPSIAAFLASASALDDADGSLPVTNDAPISFPVGATIVTFSATDTAGNTGTSTATVTVVDTGTPNVTPPSNLSLSLISGTSIPVTDPAVVTFLAGASATDDVDGSLTPTNDAPANLPIGVTTVTFSATDAAGNTGTASATVTVSVTNVAPVVGFSIQQAGQTVTTITQDGGIVTINAMVTDPNTLDVHAYDWSGTAAALTPPGGTLSSGFTFDPSGLAEGVFPLILSVQDNGTAPLTGSAISLIRVIATAPTLSSTADSDGDGVVDTVEGMVDADNDRIMDYLDSSTFGPTQLQSGISGAILQTETGLALRLGETVFAIGQSGALLGAVELTDYETAKAAGTVTGADSSYAFNIGIFDFEVSGITVGGTARIVIPLTAAIPVNATYRVYTTAGGWTDFTVNANNSLSSAPGTLGSCPAAGSAAYTPGLTSGHFCVQLGIQDGGQNDADGVANGAVRNLGGVGVAAAPLPIIDVQLVPRAAATYHPNDGEQVLLEFTLTSDSNDAEIRDLAIGATGNLNEVSAVQGVALYHDANQDGIADPSEILATGVYSADNGQVVFDLGTPFSLSTTATHFLITYIF